MGESRQWRMSIVGHGEVDPRTLVAHPRNPKVHPVEQDRVVEASLRQAGWVKSVQVNTTTGHILDGHERVELAIARGEATVPVEYVTIPAEDEAGVLLTLDASAALAQVELERWAGLAVEARQETEDPVLLAFWAQLATQHGAGVGQDETDGQGWQGSWSGDREAQEQDLAARTEALRAEWGVEAGQVWQCGRHRLWCGDSLGADVVPQLMGAEVVDLVVTSPPYSVGKGYERGAGVDEHRDLLRRLAERSQAVVRPGGFVVVNFAGVWAQERARAWTGAERACLYPMEVEYWRIYREEYGWDLYAQRAWVKPFAKLRQPLWTYQTSLAHQQEWEQVWTWRLPGGAGEQVYDWDTSVHAVWDSRVQWVDPDGSGPWAHWSAGFPRYIPEQVLKAHSAVGAVVWEPFLGGGTTLLACEALGRRCLGSDSDPGAIAVTLQRWSEATGLRPRQGV